MESMRLLHYRNMAKPDAALFAYRLERLIKIVLAVFVFSLLASTVGAQVTPPEVEWEHTYGGAGDDRAWSVQQTTDGGYIIAGWTHSFGTGASDVYCHDPQDLAG